MAMSDELVSKMKSKRYSSLIDPIKANSATTSRVRFIISAWDSSPEKPNNSYMVKHVKCHTCYSRRNLRLLLVKHSLHQETKDIPTIAAMYSL